MYRDNTLIPTETIRLAALGSLMERTARYADLAREVRYFTARLVGPSLDLFGSSLELLDHEGLVELEGTPVESAILRITPAGREAFRVLMTSNVRAPVNDVSKLVIALKLRFLHLLDEAERREQGDVLAEMCATELARLEELKQTYAEGCLGDWLALEIAQVQDRLAWFRSLDERF